jgi:hypothetical protein
MSALEAFLRDNLQMADEQYRAVMGPPGRLRSR